MKMMSKPILLFILAFLIIGLNMALAQVPVMRGLPLSGGTKLLFDKGAAPNELGKESGWGKGKKKKTSSWGGATVPEPRSGRRFQNEMILKKSAISGGTFIDPCPGSVRLARKQALIEAANFAKKNPSGTWELFMHKFRQQYSTCTPFIKRAYLDVAKEVLVPKPKAMFQR